MKVRVEVVCLNADGEEQRRQVLTIERRELAMETLGMNLSESKALLAAMAGTAVLATTPMANSPTDTSARIAPNLCANHCNLLNDGQDDVTLRSYIITGCQRVLFPSTIRYFLCSLLFLVRPFSICPGGPSECNAEVRSAKRLIHFT